MFSRLDIADLPRSVIRYGVGLWRRRWTVATVAWIAALAGWFALWLVPDKVPDAIVVYEPLPAGAAQVGTPPATVKTFPVEPIAKRVFVLDVADL